MVGRCNFFYLLIKRPESGVDTGSVGLVETQGFFLTPHHNRKIVCIYFNMLASF